MYIEPNYIHFFESAKGRGRKKTVTCARNTSCHMRKKRAVSDIKITLPSWSSTSQFNCKSFRNGSLTAVGPAGYHGGVHRLLNTAIPLNVVYKEVTHNGHCRCANRQWEERISLLSANSKQLYNNSLTCSYSFSHKR